MVILTTRRRTKSTSTVGRFTNLSDELLDETSFILRRISSKICFYFDIDEEEEAVVVTLSLASLSENTDGSIRQFLINKNYLRIDHI